MVWLRWLAGAARSEIAPHQLVNLLSLRIEGIGRSPRRPPYSSLRGNSGVGWPMAWPWVKPPQDAASINFGSPDNPSCA